MKLHDQDHAVSTAETVKEAPEVFEAETSQAEKQAAEFEKIKASLAAEGKKLISFAPLTERLAATLFQALEELVALKGELTKKAETSTEQNALIKKRLNYLVEEKKMRLNTAHYQSFDESITTYIDLLKKITDEVEGEVLNCARYVSQNPPQFVVVDASESDSFHDHLVNKIKWIKRHGKNIKKDLSVSFSRYELSLNNQSRQLSMLEILAKQTKPAADGHDHDHDNHADHAHALHAEKQTEHAA